MALSAGSVLLINTLLSNRMVLENEFNALTEVIALSVIPSLIFDNSEEAKQTLQSLHAHKNVIYAAVIKPG
ncbi:CHASE sensor domain-containing protein [Methylomarinum vadi]|uniref:CHASE sensor domain-containing protein n=1 Tax=Methylomarinum vadi TaxID=438855 RepID=UPI0004DF06FA|nr:CHASE sensor domain-containing protein [Methylomarinum vadi]